MRYLLSMFAALLIPFYAVADDHGDKLAEATVIDSSGVNIAGVMDPDVDVDWFMMPVAAGETYTINFSNGTIDDLEVVLYYKPASGEKIYLDESDNLLAPNGDGQLVWTNDEGFGAVYFKVQGFARFTSGTYTISIDGELGGGDPDSDNDGLLDSWEEENFPDLESPWVDPEGDEDQDGNSNADEFSMGTDPNDPTDGLYITSIIPVTTSTLQITWASVAGNEYELCRFDEATDEWVPVGSAVEATGPSSSQVDPNASGATFRYRVEFTRSL